MEKLVKIMVQATKKLGVAGLILGLILVMDFATNQGVMIKTMLSKAAGIENVYTCKGSVNTPTEIEMKMSKERELQYYQQLVEKNPNDDELKEKLAQVEMELEEAIEQVENYIQSEAYQDYLKAQQCNQLKAEKRFN